MRDKQGAYCEIFPKIGIARLGNSINFFIGPEAPGLPADGKKGTFKDEKGFILRHGARIRIYGFDDAGSVVKDLTSDQNTSIMWRVSLANKKATWHQFVGGKSALDIQCAVPYSSVGEPLIDFGTVHGPWTTKSPASR